MNKFKLTAVITATVIGLGAWGVYSSSPSRKAQYIPIDSPGGKRISPQTESTKDHRVSVRMRANQDTRVTLDAKGLEDARKELRKILEQPSRSSSYPPRELQAALARFGDQFLEAMPVLLERLDSNDYETRLWSVFGIRSLMINSYGTAAFSQALAQAQPKLSALFRSEDEPSLLRHAAFESLMPSGMKLTPNETPLAAPMDLNMVADLTSVLQSTRKDSESFRFEIADKLIRSQINLMPADADVLKGILNPMLKSDKPGVNLLAAYTLAALPGEKPPGMKEIFIQSLALRGTSEGYHSSYAADGLGLMGADAKDAVGALLEYAKETQNWGNGGYAKHAYDAIRLIDPKSAGLPPETDASAQQSNARIAQEIQVIKDKQTDSAEPDSPYCVMGNLTLQAALMTFDNPNPTMQAAVNEWSDRNRTNTRAAVTTERFQSLAQTIKSIDPSFHDEWVKQLLKTYPNLDRIIGKGKN